MRNFAFAAARFLGRSRKIAIFAGMVAAAGAANEIRRRRAEHSTG